VTPQATSGRAKTRFALLHHCFEVGQCLDGGQVERGGEDHFDLMFEFGGKLLTWQLPEVPAAGQRYPARRLADHRLVYLDYEGPVSGNRGWVERVDGGPCEISTWTRGLLVAHLEGQLIRGTIRIATEGGASVLDLSPT